MKIKCDVGRCDICGQLFEMNFYPPIKIRKRIEEAGNVISYVDIDLCDECSLKVCESMEAESDERNKGKNR